MSQLDSLPAQSDFTEYLSRNSSLLNTHTQQSTNPLPDGLTWKYPSYRDYIRHVASGRPCIQQLDHFMQSVPNPSLPVESRPSTSVLVADALIGGWRMSRTVDHSILERKDDVLLRIIVLECESRRMAWIDRNYLDVVAHFYNINPVYLWSVLTHNRVADHYPNDFSQTSYDIPISSSIGITSLEIVHTNWNEQDASIFELPSMSATVLEKKIPSEFPTFLIISTALQNLDFARLAELHVARYYLSTHNQHGPIPVLRRMRDIYEDILRHCSKDWVHRAVQFPIEPLLPYQSLILQDFRRNVEWASSWFAAQGHFMDSPDLGYIELCQLQSSVSNAELSLRQFIHIHGAPETPELDQVRFEIEYLASVIEGLKDVSEKHMQRQVAKLSLTESRKAIQMTDSVKLLTQLAFVFIPLTFSVTIFGVNAKELGSGDLPFVVVIISALIVTLIVTSATFIALWLGGRTSDPRSRKLLRLALSLAPHSPQVSFILVTFLLVGDRRMNFTRMDGRGFEDTLLTWFEKDFTGQWQFKSEILSPSKFWEERLDSVGAFVNRENWKHDYAWHRWSHKVESLVGRLPINYLKAHWIEMKNWYARLGNERGSV